MVANIEITCTPHDHEMHTILLSHAHQLPCKLTVSKADINREAGLISSQSAKNVMANVDIMCTPHDHQMHTVLASRTQQSPCKLTASKADTNGEAGSISPQSARIVMANTPPM